MVLRQALSVERGLKAKKPAGITIDVKKGFFTFLVFFFIFQTFLFKKTLAKFRAASRLTSCGKCVEQNCRHLHEFEIQWVQNNRIMYPVIRM